MGFMMRKENVLNKFLLFLFFHSFSSIFKILIRQQHFTSSIFVVVKINRFKKFVFIYYQITTTHLIMSASTKASVKSTTKSTKEEKKVEVKEVPKKETKKVEKKETKKKVEKKETKKKVEKKETKKKSTKNTDEPKEKKPRVYREVNKESVNADLSSLVAMIEEEVENLRDSKEKVKGIKFLRRVNKKLKTINKDYVRVMKMKKKNTKNGTTVSGFMKPVKITAELSKFTGWEPEKEYSRVDVTRFLCAYNKDNDQQNPEDRRQILPDDKLAALLRTSELPAGEKLTYFRLQQLIQPHFVKEAKPVEKKGKVAEKVEKLEKNEKPVEKASEKPVEKVAKKTKA
jgi:chromatin remodeling complex protein RSC6